MNNNKSDLIVEFDLSADLPLLLAELKMVQELLPELVKDVLWLQTEED